MLRGKHFLEQKVETLKLTFNIRTDASTSSLIGVERKIKLPCFSLYMVDKLKRCSKKNRTREVHIQRVIFFF